MNHRIVRSFATASLLVVGLAVASPVAQATLMIDSMVGGSPSGVSYANFDNLPLGAAGGTSGGIGVSFVTNGQTVTGAVSGLYAAPYLSNGNGGPFGDPNDGADTTKYLTTGTGQVILTFGASEKYIGLLWGSVDAYNSLLLYNGNSLVATITGSDVTNSANGDQGASGTFYVNINSTVAFNKVIATSTANSFEFDNVAYNPNTVVVGVPEPSTGIAAAMSALPLGLVWLRKRRMRARMTSA